MDLRLANLACFTWFERFLSNLWGCEFSTLKFRISSTESNYNMSFWNAIEIPKGDKWDFPKRVKVSRLIFSIILPSHRIRKSVFYKTEADNSSFIIFTFFFLIAINLEAVLEGFSDCASLTSLIFTALWHVRDSRLSIQAIYYFIIVDDENLQLQFNNFQSFENWCVLEARSVMRFPLIELNLCYFFGIFDEIANLRQRSIAMFVFW